METASNQRSVSASEAVALTPSQLAQILHEKDQEIVHLRRQVAWFQRQIFGQKSERRHPLPDSIQGTLGQDFSVIAQSAVGWQEDPGCWHMNARANSRYPREGGDETVPFFDETKVPVRVIAVANPEIAGLDPDDYQVIGEKVSYRLAQRPGAYEILKYVREVIKRRDTQALSCPLAPLGVIEGSRADVSFLAGMMVDKFVFHLPLYRQHRRLQDAGFKVSRSWLTALMQQAVALLEPIYESSASIDPSQSRDHDG